MPDFYPIFLNLQDQPCTVVGGGQVAEGKVDGLLAAGARVTVIAPRLSQALRACVDAGQVTYVSRVYRPGDLAGAFLVISATDHPETNRQVWQEATTNRQPVNVVDDPPYCTFIAPSVMRQGDLSIAISTGGKAPALAVRIKERLQEQLGPHYARFLYLAGRLRRALAQHSPDFETRKALWYRLVDSDVLELLEQGDEPAALQRISEIVGFRFEPEDTLEEAIS
jgi:siroheme synthase-like protein